MKILWLSPNSGLLTKVNKGYGTGGWIGALLSAVLEVNPPIQIAFAYPYIGEIESCEQDGILYYSIQQKKMSVLKKFLVYYGIKHESNNYETQIKQIIADFKPDLIHVFGMENHFIDSLSNVNLPIVVHLQGLLLPIANAFFPAGFSIKSVLFPFSKNELFLRNGIGYSYRKLLDSSKKEPQRYRHFHFFMGRTHFDYMLSSLLSPTSNYYKVNEVLRPIFYKNIGRWKFKNGKIVLFSTLSQATYKGLDVILKAADILCKLTEIDFEWRIAGINANSHFTQLFEHHYGLDSKRCNINYLGILSADDLLSELLNASIFIHPSYIDNSPNSVCEAQILGVPVIACNVGGVSTILDDGKSGVLVPANAPYEIVYYVKKLTTDIEYTQTLGQKASEYASKRHNKTLIVHDLLSAYTKIITDYPKI